MSLQVPKQAAQETQEAAAAVPVRNSDPGGFDMFADGIDADMFSDAPVLNAAVAPEKKALLDNYDDAEGYYNFQVPHSFQSTHTNLSFCGTMHNFLGIWVWLAMYVVLLVLLHHVCNAPCWCVSQMYACTLLYTESAICGIYKILGVSVAFAFCLQDQNYCTMANAECL